jgi:hypothetical protein
LSKNSIKEKAKQVRGFAKKSGDLGGAAEQLYKILEVDFKRLFDSSPSTTSTAEVYGGARWERLSDATLKRNPKRLTGKQLIDTGELKRSFERGKPGNIARTTPRGVEFGSSLKKAERLNKKRSLAPPRQRLKQQAVIVMLDYVIGKGKP